VRQFCHWLGYDAAELGGNKRKTENGIEGVEDASIEYLSGTVDIGGRGVGMEVSGRGNGVIWKP
jgi:hypothetical protein